MGRKFESERFEILPPGHSQRVIHGQGRVAIHDECDADIGPIFEIRPLGKHDDVRIEIEHAFALRNKAFPDLQHEFRFEVREVPLGLYWNQYDFSLAALHDMSAVRSRGTPALAPFGEGPSITGEDLAREARGIERICKCSKPEMIVAFKQRTDR